ncbi:alpha/beta hydrolase family protein [Prosthecobacter sp.]|uniref:alpha/beta hydrolase family protein n=1 Tax=Prosthecobacter sp. TaxID=1965333 RepID=UPI0037838761
MKTAFFLALVLACCCVSAHADDLKPRLQATGVTATTAADFHGFAELDFALPGDGAECKIVSPKKTAAGSPWVWRARFWGHEPAFEIALLEQGYHVAYCDVVEFWGAPKAVERWNQFYALTQKIGLGPKPVLEGMSRGGTYIFNWAKANPGKVTAIYADNPLLDLRAFPNNTKEARAMRKECLESYGITEKQLPDFKGSPIDGLEGLAAAKVPVFLVLGMKDDVVPPKLHADVLEARYKALGGTVRRWEKPEAGHHPHGLDPVQPLVDAVLEAAR